MRLPLLSADDAESPEAMIRAIKKAVTEINRCVGRADEIEGALVFTNPARPRVFDANCAFEVRTADGERLSRGEPPERPEDVLSRIAAHFAQHHVRCHLLVANEPAFGPQWEQPLRAAGYECRRQFVMAMRQYVAIEGLREDVQVLPARAVLGQYRELRRAAAADAYGADVADELADYFLDALDETRLDMLVARVGGEPVAAAGVMSLGETGIIWDVVTHPAHRRKGVMRTLMHHVVELAGRSQFRRLILETAEENEIAQTLYRSMGMETIGAFEVYTLRESLM